MIVIGSTLSVLWFSISGLDLLSRGVVVAWEFIVLLGSLETYVGCHFLVLFDFMHFMLMLKYTTAYGFMGVWCIVAVCGFDRSFLSTGFPEL